MNIWFDGSGWNGKTSGYAVVFEDPSFEHIIVIEPVNRTNNEMEYEGAIEAATHASPGDTLITDSQLVEGQVNRGWKINFEHLQILNDKLKPLLREKNLTIKWVPRNDNKAGKLFE